MGESVKVRKSKQKGTPEYKRRQVRIQKRRAANDPVTKEAQAGANLKYGEAERDVQSQLRVSDAQSQRIPGLFDAYRQRLQELGSAQQAGYAQAQSQMAQLQQQSAGQIGQDSATINQAQQSAQLRGTTADPMAGSTAVNAAATRRFGTDVSRGTLTAQGANYGASNLGQ